MVARFPDIEASRVRRLHESYGARVVRERSILANFNDDRYDLT